MPPPISLTAIEPLVEVALAERKLAFKCYSVEDFSGAHEHFLLSLNADPLNADTLADLASLALQENQTESAIRWGKRAVALEPAHDAARYTLAGAFRELGNIESSIAILNALLEDKQLSSRAPDLALAARQDLAELLGRPSLTSNLIVINPRELFLGKRLDILVKYLYARQFLGLQPKQTNIDATRLYRQHIHLRTGGAEPGDSDRKATLEDFVKQYDALINSMAEIGFDPSMPAPISADDGLPLNGAHRLGAALAIGCDVAVTFENKPGGLWDFNWFRDHGFSRDDLNLLLRTLAELKPEHLTITILWSPVENNWDALESRINESMPVVNSRTLEFSRHAFNELVHDMYSFDWGPRTGENIDRKIKLLANFPPSVRVIFSERPFDSDPSLPKSLKIALRDAYSDTVPVDYFTTLHISESAAETAHLVSIFTNENNLLRLSQRKSPRPELIDMLVEMTELLTKQQIAVSDCCVVGAAVLDALSIRPADDVDFTLISEERFKHYHGGVTQLTPRVDVVSYNYPRSFSSEPALTDDEMIARPENYFLVRGIRFADPRIVMTRKQHQRRDKDMRDVQLLSHFFENNLK